LHDTRRVTGNVVDRLLVANRLGYRLSREEQYLLALAAKVFALISRNEWTAEYELRMKKDGAAAA
jgi:hypothetical protein